MKRLLTLLFLFGVFILPNSLKAQEKSPLFSGIPFYGDSTNYSPIEPYLWALVEDGGDMRYGIIYDKEWGGNRTSLIKDKSFGNNFQVSADVKLFKRVYGYADDAMYEDASLFFLYTDVNNYAKAEFFNTHGAVTGTGNDPFGLSGFTVVVEGVTYKFKKGDAPEDPVEGTPAERCIPYVNDASFADWNNIKLTREGSVLSMLVNNKVYYSMDIDTVKKYQSGVLQGDVPQSVKDFLKGAGQVGIGSSNDKVYFDNVDAGYLPVTGKFSDIAYLGEAGNFTPADPWLWSVVDDGGDMRLGIVYDKEMGGNRTNILKDKSLGFDFYVTADAKLFKRVWGADNQQLFEDASLFFLYTDPNNFVKAEFFNTSGQVTGAGNDPFGLSGFTIVVNGVTYKLKKADAPEDPIEGTPAETCIPYVNDASFADWNNLKVTRKGSVLSMYVNSKIYYSVNIDTLTTVQSGAATMPIPQEVKDYLMGSGQVGIGTANDKVYFDNVDAGLIPVTGKFSDIDYLGEAGNFSPIDPWLWSVVDDGGDMRLGIVYDKEMGGTRTNILKDKTFGFDFYVTADAKLFKRVWGADNQQLFEDASLFFLYTDPNNFVKAEFFNTSGQVTGAGNDPFGLSGFTIMVNGVTYKLKTGDAPADPVEGTAAETCIPYVNDASFADWNNLKVTRKGSVLSMYVNGKVYYSVDINTLTTVQSGATTMPIPQEVKDYLMGSGQVGIGTANDKVYFDNVDAGLIPVTGKFSDIAYFGEAGNFSPIDSWLWSVVDDGGDKRLGIVYDKEMGGNRTNIIKDKSLGFDFYVTADAKLFKRVWGADNQQLFEDASLFFLYTDPNNFVKAEFFNTSGQVTGTGNDPFGLSGFTIMVNGVTYKLKKGDAPADPVEGTAAETCIPYVNDASFADWNNLKVTRKGSVLSMYVNGKVYYSVDINTLTTVQSGAATMPIPQEVKDYLMGSGLVGIGTANDKVYFDNVDAGLIPVTGKFSDIAYFGEAGNFSQVDPWLWNVVDDGGNARYGIIYDKEMGGTRTSIVKDKSVSNDFFVTADAKLFKRVWGADDQSLFEDASLFFLYTDQSNFVKAEFFNTSGQVTGSGNDPFGLSGFTIMVNGVTYKLKKGDAPEDPVEGTPAERCIPYVNDASFADWNNLKVTRKGSVLSMYVNGKIYHSVDINTLTTVQSGAATMPIPQAVKEYLMGSGQIGIGSANDKVYFDNVNGGDLLLDAAKTVKDGKAQECVIYPNPATSYFTISNISQFRNIEFYNIAGQKVSAMITDGSSSVRIDATQFKRGVYIARLSNKSGEVMVGKFIIK